MAQSGTQSSAVPFTVRLPEQALNALDHLANQTDRTRNWIVARAVDEYLALNAWQMGKIEAGIAAADAGEFATEEEVEQVLAQFDKRASSTETHPPDKVSGK